VLAPDTARQMLAIMETVTKPGGTALEAVPPGFTVAGKTGTAQKLVGRAYSHSKYNALFIGLTPAQKPALAIAVIIDEPKGAIYGGVVAAPIFREIAAQSLRFLGYYPKARIRRSWLDCCPLPPRPSPRRRPRQLPTRPRRRINPCNCRRQLRKSP